MAKGPNPAMEKRMMLVLIIFMAAGFLALAGRLVYLQIINGNFFEKQAVEQQLREIPVSAKRGTIYDRNMKPLAESATVWTVYVSPNYITNEKMRGNIADELSKVLGLDRAAVFKQISKKTGYEIIKKKVEKPEADILRAYIKSKDLGCVGLTEDSKRYYPYGNFLAQVLGFTGADNQGLAGLEAQYESVLKGVPGKMVSAKNATGTDMPYKYETYIEPQDGTNLVLTIDEVVQHYLEKHLQDALVANNVGNKVTGIVMNVNTGAIVAMATEPDYDPNSPYQLSAADLAKLSGLSGDALKKTKSDLLQNMWRNKAISDPYEPGSCFKIVTSAAGLEEKVVTEKTMFYDPGYKIVAGVRISCWKAGGHGQETFLQGMENSCNPVFMTVAELLGARNFFKYYQAFGLTEKTGIDLPGEAGTTGLYHTEKQLGPVELASSSFGQTNKMTPIQLITAVAAAANGGKLVTPHLVERETDSSGNIVKSFGTQVKRQVISAATSKELCGMLEQVVSVGTGKNAYVKGYRIAGKTGTSQKMDKDGGKSLRIASFMGFAPADNPQYAVLIIFDEPHNPKSNFGGVIAGPVEGAIFSDILPYLGVEPKYTAEELAAMDVKTPSVTGRSVSDAQAVIQKLGLKVKIVGQGTTITTQCPEGGQPTPHGGTVVLNTGQNDLGDTVTVPNVTDVKPSAANSRIAEAGLNIRLSGNDLTSAGVVSYKQDPAAGTKVKPGTVVTVSFRNNDLKVD